MRTWIIAVAVGVCCSWATATEPQYASDPYWVLLHEPAARAELKLASVESDLLRKYIDGLDLKFFPLRNHSADEFNRGLAQLVTEARERLPQLISNGKAARFEEILLRQAGVPGLLREPAVSQMSLHAEQRSELEKIISTGQSKLHDLEERASKGDARSDLEKVYAETQLEMQKQALAVLTPEQKSRWKELVGADFDTGRLGHAEFKVPELIDSGKWINSSALQLEKLHGKVVVLHFYACDCGNCQNNLPWYKKWYEQFHGQGLEMIGIHTPETSAEQQLAHVTEAAQKEKLKFPILFDDQKANWNAWGNGIWPAVYLIDKRGYLRRYWLGELNWQGGNGEEQMRGTITALLKEDAVARD